MMLNEPPDDRRASEATSAVPPREVATLLRLEGAAISAAGICGYFALTDSWLLLALAAFLPDLSILGYSFGPRAGARIYNLAHTYVAPAILAATALAFGLTLLALACVWVAHIGFDRALGYGLKHDSDFKRTHLGLIGRRTRS